MRLASPNYQAAFAISCGLMVSTAALARQNAPQNQPAPQPPQPAAQPAVKTPEDAQSLTGLPAVLRDAEAAHATVSTDLARSFLDAASHLKQITARTIYRDSGTKTWLTEKQRATLPEAARGGLQPRPCDEQFYYTTKYGSPIAYVRAIDLVAQAGFHSEQGAAALKGKKVLDFGYGGIGQLQLMALQGASAVGVDVDPLLPVLYSLPEDQGPLGSAGGSVTLVDGKWPTDAAIKAKVGQGYDLIISKNTLKKGYIHPRREADKRMLIDLGVSDDAFITALYESLAPGGMAIIYNLCPAPAPDDKPYIPWADGQCPFPREALEKAGFTVHAFDQVDDAAIRTLARALTWEAQGMKVDSDLFAWYTIIQRP